MVLWQGPECSHLTIAPSAAIPARYERVRSKEANVTKSSKTPLLDTIVTPADLREFPESDLRQIADELRTETIDAVSITGGHLGAGLGVVELTVALHHVFNTPDDRIIWDVGHQAYPHKILTGRRDRIRTLRKGGGLSGFTNRGESEYDPFGAGHSSTSISAGLGMAVANSLSHKDKANVIAVIGDGAMSAGMAYEAMNNAGAMHARLIVILNDNEMSIAPPAGALSAYLARLVSGGTYRTVREAIKQLGRHLPKFVYDRARKTEEFARNFWSGGTMFEELGFYYVGPIDGHNLDHLLPVLKNVRDAETGPILVHVVTQKGKGYGPAEESYEKGHAVVPFDVITGTQNKPKANAPSYTKVFADALIAEAKEDDKVVAVTAAMPNGTGLDLFAKTFPDRTFDVGIAEQHAVTFCAGLATEGYKPFCAIYSTFLQRAYDQVVHDVAIQNLPVRFAIDRAGLVGADGATHAGSFDTSFLGILPNMVVMAAADEAELVHMVATAVAYDKGPIAFRYPARRRRRHRAAEEGHRAGDRQGPHRARGQAGRHPFARHAPQGGAAGGRGPGEARHLGDRRRRPLRQAARPGDDPQASRRPRGADHHRGRLGRRLRLVRAAGADGGGRLRHRPPEVPLDGVARRLHRARQAREALHSGRSRREGHRGEGAGYAGAGCGGQGAAQPERLGGTEPEASSDWTARGVAYV